MNNILSNEVISYISDAPPKVIHEVLKDDRIFPNSSLPILVYQGVLHLPHEKSAEIVEQLFQKNGWGNNWQDSIFSYHHYHSNTHEVLGIASGQCVIIVGGQKGSVFNLSKGDVIIIPAGVAHKSLNTSEDFKCVGGYWDAKEFDINTGKAGERPATEQNIAEVVFPGKDPVFGIAGPLFDYWEPSLKRAVVTH